MNRAKTGSADRSTTRGADFLQLDPSGVLVGGLADWLAGELRRAISDGRLGLGTRLPATRVLAGDLRVSRGVVTEAYRRLVEDGQVAGRGRAGTVVVATPLAVSPAAVSLDVVQSVALPRGSIGPFPDRPGVEVFEALRAAPARIDLTPGVPDLAAFPRAGWLRAERAVLARLSSADFGYGDPRGAPDMRHAVAAWLARNRGIAVDPGEVVVVAGVAQALGLFARALLEDGVTAAAVEDPGSLGIRQHLNYWGLATPPVPVDEGGVRVDELRATGARAVLLTPAHQFPTGVVLDGERRRELMRWAGEGETDRVILEDDYDAEHRYDRPPVPALRSMLPEQVCYAGSVSKWLAPALRLGWALVPPRHRGAVFAAKRNADLGNPVLAQLTMAALMESGEMERQLRLVRARHRRRRDAMIEAVAAHLPGAVVHGAAAGLHLMVTFPAGSPADTALAAAALARGVKVQPLSWHRQRPGPPGLVLGYAARVPTEITDGVAALGDALRELGATQPGATQPGAEPATGPGPARGSVLTPDGARTAPT